MGECADIFCAGGGRGPARSPMHYAIAIRIEPFRNKATGAEHPGAVLASCLLKCA